MLNADRALEIILRAATRLPSEKVKLRRAPGRTLVSDITAAVNIPPFDNSSMDGFALRAADIRSASKKSPVRLEVIGESSAGNVFDRQVASGQSVRIMTGGKVPVGADCVVPVEVVRPVDAQRVEFVAPAKTGAHIRRAGEDIKAKEVVLRKGSVVSPPDAAILASLGHAKVKVTCKPRVNILATGDELVEPGKTLREGKIHNSTSYALAGFAAQCGAKPHLLGIVRDKKKRILNAIRKALDCDLLVITGGVSVGAHDYVKEALAEAGVETKFWRVNIKPGGPLYFGVFSGRKGNTLVFGLPGNPASTAVTFLQFVRPAIEKILGTTAARHVLPAVLDETLRKSDGKRHFVSAAATLRGDTLHVRSTGSQSSGMMSSIAKANCFVVIREGRSSLKKGTRVAIELFS